MVLYTILDPADVMTSAELPARKTVLHGKLLLECSLDADAPVIERLISTDPADYLNRKFSPGQRFRR